jgi:hypothetical protein
MFVIMIAAIFMLLDFAGLFKGDLTNEIAFSFLVQIYFIITVWYRGIYQKITKKGTVQWKSDHFKGLVLRRSPFSSVFGKKVEGLPTSEEKLSAKAKETRDKIKAAEDAWEEANKPLDETIKKEIAENVAKYEDKKRAFQEKKEDEAKQFALNLLAPVFKWVNAFLKPIRRFLTQNNDSLLEDLGSLHVKAQEANIKKIAAAIEGDAQAQAAKSSSEEKISDIIPGYPHTFQNHCGNFNRVCLTNAELKAKAEKFAEEQAAGFKEDASDWLMEIVESFTC